MDRSSKIALGSLASFSTLSYLKGQYIRGQLEVQRAGMGELLEIENNTKTYFQQRDLEDGDLDSIDYISKALKGALTDRGEFFYELGRFRELSRKGELDRYGEEMSDLEEEIDELVL